MASIVFAEMFEYPDDVVKWKDAAERIVKGAPVLFDEERKLLIKGILLQKDGTIEKDKTLDISNLYGVFTFDFPINFIQIKDTVTAIEKILLDQSPSGGSPRYEHDNYFASDPPFMGNPWFVTTLWMSQYYMRNGSIEKARGYIDWTRKHSYTSGALAEQINPTSGESVSVAPLVWSHAELINSILDLDQVEHPNKN
jgi:GH15 family glucan-1,4-alpha-glucosidase